jgi:hypothetical protein
MTARVVDLAKHAQAKRSLNGHGPPRQAADTRTLSIDFLSSASQRDSVDDMPTTADGRVYVLINPDNTFTLKVAREGEKNSLILQGTEASSAPLIMREVICWLFGVPA